MATKIEPKNESHDPAAPIRPQVSPDAVDRLLALLESKDATIRELVAQRGASPVGGDFAKGAQTIAEYKQISRPQCTFDLYSAPFEWEGANQDAHRENGEPMVALTAIAWFVDRHDRRGPICFKLDRMAETTEFRERCLRETMRDQGSLPAYDRAIANPLEHAQAASLVSAAAPLAKNRMRQNGSLPAQNSLVSQGHPFHVYRSPSAVRKMVLRMGPLTDANGNECGDDGKPLAPADVAAAAE